MGNKEILKNPRVIVIQKLYSYQFNKKSSLVFEKHRYKKFIQDIVKGTIERKDLIDDFLIKEFKNDININKTELIVKIIITAAIFEFMFRHKTSINIIINEYVKTSEFFVNDKQKKFLNAILDKISKKARSIYE